MMWLRSAWGSRRPAVARTDLASSSKRCQAADRLVDDFVLLAEREANEVSPGGRVVIEDLRRDRHHAGPFGQGAGQFVAVVQAQRSDVGLHEVGALRPDGLEAGGLQAGDEPVALGLQRLAQVLDPAELVAQG